VSEESARPHRACCFLDRSCEFQPRRGDPIKRTGRTSLAGALENLTGRKVMMMVGMRSLEVMLSQRSSVRGRCHANGPPERAREARFRGKLTIKRNLAERRASRSDHDFRAFQLT
jgi:hypothetical protein